MKAFVLIDYGYEAGDRRNALVILASDEAGALLKLETVFPGQYTESRRGKIVTSRPYGIEEVEWVA